MATVAARNASFYVESSGASTPISSLTNNVVLTYSAATPEVTGFGNDDRQRMQDGIKDWTLKFDAYFGDGAAETDAILEPLVGASTGFWFGPSGSSASSILYTACAILQSYEMTFGLENAGQCSGTMVARSGSLTRTQF